MCSYATSTPLCLQGPKKKYIYISGNHATPKRASATAPLRAGAEERTTCPTAAGTETPDLAHEPSPNNHARNRVPGGTHTAPTATGSYAQTAETRAATPATNAATNRVHRARAVRETDAGSAADGSRRKGTRHTAAARSESGADGKASHTTARATASPATACNRSTRKEASPVNPAVAERHGQDSRRCSICNHLCSRGSSPSRSRCSSYTSH